MDHVEFRAPRPRTEGIVVILFFLFIILWGCFVTVPAGHRGVVLALSRSISAILVQYKSIEKWNGVLPQVSWGAVPFVNLGKPEGRPETPKRP